MATILRAAGRDFDVDAFLVDCTLPVCGLHRRGEPVFPASQPDGRRHDRSNINIEVSDAGFGEFGRQITEAVAFLAAEGEQVRRLCGWPGVEGVDLDFGIAWRDVVAQSDHLPAVLVRWAGALGLGIELSHYPVSGEDQGSKKGTS